MSQHHLGFILSIYIYVYYHHIDNKLKTKDILLNYF